MRLILFTLLIFNTLIGYTQPDNLKGKSNEEISKYYIHFLKDGALFVRLQTKSRKIEILKKAGNIAAANKVKSDQIKINKSIIKSFKDGFTFCPVFFFYSHDTKHVMKHQLDSVKFLNSELQHDPNIETPNQFLTAEFAIIKEDTSKNYPGNNADGSHFYAKDSLGNIKEVKYYNGGTNMSFGALLIKSDQFIQLTKPFPYYVRNLATLPILRRSHFKVVTLLNTKLFYFLDKPY